MPKKNENILLWSILWSDILGIDAIVRYTNKNNIHCIDVNIWLV